MKNMTNFDFTNNCKRSEKGWLVRCPDCENYEFISAEKCHACYIDAMALNNKTHKGHNCKEGFYYRLQRSEGNLI
jgi:predicted ATP-dependent serine protease